MDGQMDRLTNRQIDGQTVWHMGGKKDEQMYRRTDELAQRQSHH